MDDLKLLRKYLPEQIGIKAVGGLRTLDDVLAVDAAGCSRIGTARTAAILDEWKARLEAGGTAQTQ
jgi:deoxyribose-phosphate aldolase